MAFEFFEIPEHLESTASPATYTSHWMATGTTSQSYVQSYALGATPGIIATIYGTLYRQDIRVRQTAYNQFSVEVPYGTRKNDTGDWTWDFDTTGGTIHITNGKETKGKYPTATAPDTKGAIGVEGDQVKGTDIIIPALKINVLFKHPLGIITIARAKYLASITGTINSASFLTFAAGEVLFLGARGSDGTDAEAITNYQFAMSSNVTGLSLGDITGIAKRGWDAVWIRYKDDSVAVGGVTKPIRVPQYVYVERVYEEVDLATALGFG